MSIDVTLPSAAHDALPLEQQVARLQALLEATRRVHSTIRTQEVMLETARILVRELEAEGAQFTLPGADVPAVSAGRLPATPSERHRTFPLLSRDNDLLAELTVIPPDDNPFGLYEHDFIEGLVLQTAVALENAAFHERDVEWARVQQDLNAARSVQRSLLPGRMPDLAGFSIAARSSTCYEVGGDYLDAIALPDGSHLMVVADVAGKGLASAIVATGFRAAIRSLATQPVSLHELAERMANQHWNEGEEARRRYMTALLVRVGHADTIEIVNAGHNPAALVLPDGAVRMISASGVPLGMLSGASYATESLDFPPGARLLLYTDGLTEVFRGEEEFGEERLLAEFRGLPAQSADRSLDRLWTAIHAFADGTPQTDDMTAMIICRHQLQEQEITPG